MPRHCSSRLPVTDRHPAHKYDCDVCKFSWCCGPLCACLLSGAAEPPKKRADEIERLHKAWRTTLKNENSPPTAVVKINHQTSKVMFIHRERRGLEAGAKIRFKSLKAKTWCFGIIEAVLGGVLYIRRSPKRNKS